MSSPSALSNAEAGKASSVNAADFDWRSAAAGGHKNLLEKESDSRNSTIGTRANCSTHGLKSAGLSNGTRTPSWESIGVPASDRGAN